MDSFVDFCTKLTSFDASFVDFAPFLYASVTASQMPSGEIVQS